MTDPDDRPSRPRRAPAGETVELPPLSDDIPANPATAPVSPFTLEELRRSLIEREQRVREGRDTDDEPAEPSDEER
jgi:hypothetical protein